MTEAVADYLGSSYLMVLLSNTIKDMLPILSLMTLNVTAKIFYDKETAAEFKTKLDDFFSEK